MMGFLHFHRWSMILRKCSFFAIINSEDNWHGVYLNTINPLFCVSVGNVVIQRLGIRMVHRKEVVANNRDFSRFYIKPYDNAEVYSLRDEFIWRGGSLVDVGEDCRIDR